LLLLLLSHAGALKGSIGRHTDVLSNILVRYPGILVSVSWYPQDISGDLHLLP